MEVYIAVRAAVGPRLSDSVTFDGVDANAVPLESKSTVNCDASLVIVGFAVAIFWFIVTPCPTKLFINE